MKKIVSVILSLCMITAILPMYVTAAEIAQYYVAYNGTGNGTSADTPMGSVAAAINAIESNSSAKSGVVYIISDTIDKGLTVGEKTIPYPAWDVANEYTKPITIEGYAQNSASVLAASKNYGNNVLAVKGPTTFKNISILAARTWDAGIETRGYDITFENTVKYLKPADEPLKDGQWTAQSNKITTKDDPIVVGSGRGASTGNGGRVTINTDSKYTVTNDWKDSSYSNDVTVAADTNGKGLTFKWSGQNVTYAKNLNFVFGNTGNVTSTASTGTITVNGGLQVIRKSGNDFAIPSNVTVNGGKWDIVVSETDIMDVTETAGTFKVLYGGGQVFAFNGNDKIYYNKIGENLVLPAGNWTVYTTAKAAQDSVSGTFVGWSDDGNGIMTGQYDTRNEFYVKYKGTGDGTSADTPMGSVAAAIKAIELNSHVTSGTVYIISDSVDKGLTVGEREIPFTPWDVTEVHTKPITIVGYAQNSASVLAASKNYGNNVLAVKGPTTFKNISILAARAWDAGIETRGYDVTFENTVKYLRPTDDPLVNGTWVAKSKNITTKEDPIVVGSGRGASTGNGGRVTINTDSKYTVTNDWKDSSYSNDVTVAADTNGKGLTFKWSGQNVTYAKNLNFVFGNTGNVTSTASTGTITVNGALQVIRMSGFAIPSNVTVNGGKWDLSVSEAGMIDVTATAGTFKVNGEKTIMAIDKKDGEAYISSNGNLTVPQGEYNVSLADDVDYRYANDKITFYKNVSNFSLSSVTPYVKEGKAFIGWTKNGEAAANIADYASGDVLTAQYADVDEAFRIAGAQVRKSDGDTKLGLRFVVEKSNLIENDLGEILGYGTLVLPTDLTRGHDFKYEEAMYNEYVPALPETVSATKWGTDSWNSEDGPTIVPAVKTPVGGNGSIMYSVCIVNIPEKYYDRFYMVKGYIRFTDLNGNVQTAYTDYYQTNLYNAAVEAINGGDTSAELAAIKDYYETTRKAVYMAEQYDSRTDLSSQKLRNAPYSWEETEGSANISGITNKAFYKLKNGLKIREVEYDLGGGNREPVEIVQFADTHLNYINDRDWAEQSNCILATYKGRSWNRNGDSVPGINKMMKYASFFDQSVVTGDLLDYFSWGCGEMVKKLIVEKDPTMLMAVGNHEPVVHMQAVEHECDTDNEIETAYARLQSFWTNDTKYASKIITNKDGIEMAKLVVLDDQFHKFVWEEVYNGLTADIADARVKGLPILLFMHCPMSTRGGAEEDKYSYFYEPGDSSGFDAQSDKKLDFGKREAGSSNDEMDKKTYELITNNADVIRGIFCGDYHNNMYMEVKGYNNGNKNDVMMIPQYVVTANAYGGSAIKIKIK